MCEPGSAIPCRSGRVHVDAPTSTTVRLQRGLLVRVLSPSCSTDAVTISSGTVRREGADPAGGFVPRDDWRALDADELALLAPDRPVPLRSAVFVLDVGDELLSEAHATLLPHVVPEEVTDPGAGPAAIRRFHSRVVAAVHERHGLLPDSVGAADLVVQRPGLDSTAFNPETKTFMGLHIDSHQRLPFGARDAAMVLCALNIGFTARYFHFVNLPVATLAERLADHGHDVPADSANDLRDAFLSAFPDYPVLRIALHPGQAYLCNTQNTLHDGATNHEGLPDVSFLTLNGWQPDVTPRSSPLVVP